MADDLDVEDPRTFKEKIVPVNELEENHLGCSRDGNVTNLNSEDLGVISLSSSLKPEEKKKSKFRPFFGICFAMISSLTLVVMNLFAKLCTVLPVFEIGVFRFIIQLVITMPLLIYSNDKIIFSPKIMLFLLLRGFTGTSGMLTRLYAVQNMPLGDATVLMFTTPIFVAIFGRIFLKEPLHRMYIFLLLLCLAGVILIARPSFIFGHPDTAPEYESIWLPSLSAVMSAITASISMILVRVLRRYSIKSSVIIFYFGLVGLLYSLLGSYFDRGFQFPFCQSIDYLFAICIGIFAFLVHAALNAALKFEKAFIVSLGLTSGIVFGYVVQVLAFALVPSGLSFGGAALITLCNFIIFLFKWNKFKHNV